ncbi:MAG: MmcQ/YjbR family DNA-binding protein [Deltaproteobacteria bacterium]|nr:MmcQ/YjbR family DNA-binding protein [Deltaproteobacteria bacterium]
MAYLDELRSIASQLPGTTEDVKWGADLCFCVGGKMYTVVGLDSEHTSLKVPEPVFEEMVTRKGVVPAPYLARNKWIAFEGTQAFTLEEIAKLMRGSHQLILSKLPKKVQRQLAAIP